MILSIDCQWCGTSVSLPSSGYMTVRTTNKYQNWEQSIQLPISQQGESFLMYQFHSHHELLHNLQILLEHNMHQEWVHFSDTKQDQSVPLQIEHLYERLSHPELVTIIEEGHFTSYLQPIVHMDTGEVYGYEALLRSRDGSVSPGELFSFAKRAGLHSMLDQKAREEAVKAKAELIPYGQKCFINFLPSTIYVPEHCLSHTFNIVKKYNVDPSDLIFEVVETEKIHSIDHLHNIFSTYKASGMHVALDDVGSGYSTLEVLSLLKPDFVKIDRDYIQDCQKDQSKQSFLESVQQTASELNITLLAEGIETTEEYQWLRESGIHLGQGYFIGKPSPQPIESFILP
ncbi:MULTISPECIES: EAL domain-containing protein [Pontibacillus]|uniref:EAL domain-containing protein n=1 Tax=Pontibacillus chungwhensis TaxID=265426 RepID=A0ABY8V3M6_9BACI|nr:MULTISPECIES: EAL domain-containing protein [Pontibacillus]MCD5323915.1 EAL domain-containing protein [Pontibacillus sp. HN14]WIG00234.1 EAL domain-containing protein [Pontibacillus chungwhensis]